MNALPTIKPPVCVAGAHRSGTSMLTRLLHACGLELGPESDLMPARPDNPDGFWENLRFVGLNDQVLGKLGGAWDLPPPITEDFDQPSLDPLRREGQSLIAEFENAPLWGWKDPRNCLTLPFWKQILPNLKTIVIVRNPLEVAHSMRRRNGTSHAYGLRLWEIYNRRILEWTTAEERLLTHYDFFFEQAETELRRIALFTGLPLSDTGKAAALVATGQRHTHFTLAEMAEAGLSPDVIELYHDLAAQALDGAGRPYTTRHPAKLPHDAFLLQGTTSRLHPTLPDQLADQRDVVLDRAQQEQEALRERLARFEMERQALTEDLAHSETEIEKIRDRFVQTNQLLHLRSISLSRSEERNVNLAEQLRQQLKATKKLMHFLQEAAIAAGRLQQSRRWKMSNPIAWMKSGLAGDAPPGFGHLDKVIEKFEQWRCGHPEVDHLDASILHLNPSTALESGSTSDRDRVLLPPPPVGEIIFPVRAEVEVSIIIPIFNQLRFTEACLASVQQHHEEVPFEVIVVDDCSTDASEETLRKIPGLIYLRNDSNVGFISSCNRGAEEARGRYLVFLNNDTIVTAKWLTELQETFSIAPEAGLVGSKLVYPDGRLQEAGGIIWQDGSGWNRGKFQDAAKPEYNYLCEVDYCSAASVMIKKDLFQSLGGFDLKYAPAYYEDTDLAFRVAQSGDKVLYQPLSVVVHYEGATGGTDISSGTKQYQELNRNTFVQAWASSLANKPQNGDIAAWEKPPEDRARILVIDHHLPMADRDSGSLRMFQILSLLCRLGHHVTFIPDNLADIFPYGDDLRKRGVQVMHHPYLNSIREYLANHGTLFDIAILSRCNIAQKHIGDVRRYAAHSRVIFDTVDLHFLREEREAALTQNLGLKQSAIAKRQLEYELVVKSDQTWVVSPVEQEILRAAFPDKSIEVVSNIVSIPRSATPFSLRRDILFIGNFQHPPNTDAVLFFAREVFPFVRRQLHGVRFYIIGDKAPPEVAGLADEDIVVTGYQPDVASYFESVKLSVAPLRYGAGVKGKINQSMGFGVPVVATSMAVEGMGLIPGENVLLADTPRDFADAVCELYLSEPLWASLSAASSQLTRQIYSQEAATKQLERLFSPEHLSKRSSSDLRLAAVPPTA